MQDFRLDTAKTTVYVNVEKTHVWVSYTDCNLENSQSYSLGFEHYDKLKSYKSVSALVKYAKANQITAQSNENNAEVQATLTDEAVPPCPVPVPAPAKSWDMERDIPIFVEISTTGMGSKDEVIELAIVDIDEKVLFNSQFKPALPIKEGATVKHGIKTKDLVKCPRFEKLWCKIQKLFSGKTLVFYNAEFDTRLIAQTIYSQFGSADRQPYSFRQLLPHQKIYCLMEVYARHWQWYSEFWCDYEYQKLNSAIRQQNIDVADLKGSVAVTNALKAVRLYKHLKAEGVI